MNRYKRNEMVIGSVGQKTLRDSSVLIVGCGALGSPAAMYLAGAGVGHIGLVDFDTIDLSNLQRQLFYKESETGKKKAEILSTRIKELNSDIRVTIFPELMSRHNGPGIIKDFDFVIEATDNPSSKYMIDTLCYELSKPVVIAGVENMHGQITTFVPGHSRFSDFFPLAPEQTGILPCEISGVLGPIAGIVGALEATEAIKFLTSSGTLLTDRLLTIDLATDTFMTLKG